MTNSQVTQTVFGDHNIFTGIGDINVVYQLPPVEAEDRRNLLNLLDKVKQDWIKDVLEKSIHYEVLIQLGKEARPEMVEHPWGRRVEIPDHDSRLLPQDKKLVEVFDETGRALLILGEPGSGKTFSMLELGRELIARAENDPMQPIPVVFNLSTWAIQNHSIFDWLVNELKTKYGFPKRFSGPWLEKRRLLLLLDGLDEVDGEDRANCVAAINEFFDETGLPGLVVCCRLQEYLALPKHLKLRGAICLQPLTSSQIKNYLLEAGPKLASLHTVLQEDAVLQELAETPLMLSAMSLAYQDLPVDDIKSVALDTLEKRRKKIFDTYIHRMFVRKFEEMEQDKPPYASDQVTARLSRLASGMIQHSKPIFLIEELEPDWLTGLNQFLVYGLISRILFGLIYGMLNFLYRGIMFGMQYNLWSLEIGLTLGLCIGLSAGLLFIMTNIIERRAKNWPTTNRLCSGIIFMNRLLMNVGVSYGLSIGFSVFFVFGILGGVRNSYAGAVMLGIIIGLIAGITGRSEKITNDIQTTEALTWSWQGFYKASYYSLIAGIITGLIIVLIELLVIKSKIYSRQEIVLLIILAIVLCTLFYWYLVSFLGGLKSKIIENKSFPNQGIHRTIKSALIGWFFGSVIFSTMFFLSLWMTKGLILALITGLETGLIFGLVLGILVYGGFDVIKHYTLRLILWWHGFAPLNYARFLDYASKLIFLRKVGGGYIFIHRMLMEHFAAMGKE